ncbi:MAG TPA: carotenoid oxygenase family protein [Aquihabitans sp.]|jgi:carotenoid cleavage dioxygenase|nr:carotenoid oxygenase family protein [Aquihabitans sp.]
MARRDVLRALGLGAAGISVGGLGALAGCSGDGGTATGGVVSPSSTTAAERAAALVAAYDPSVPYWEQGGFRPVTTEETLTDLRVTGTIPSALSGLFVRNGSNPPSGRSLHWFLGDGMVHGVRIRRGKAEWYRNRYVRTPLQASGKDLMEFGGVPGKANNQSNVALVHHAGKLLTTGEVGWPFQLATGDLSTVGPWDFGGRLGDTMTAHPKVDPATGRMHFFGYEFLSPALTYYAAAPDGALDVVSPVAVDRATMIHDFAITDRDVVFWIGPVVFGADPANPNPSIPFHWDPSGPCRVGVMPLDGRGEDIRWTDVPLGFTFHGLNAHRDGDDVVVRLHRLTEAFGPKGDIGVPSVLTEWRIGTAGPELTVAERPLTDRSMDLPTVDRRHLGRPSRHGWFATTTDADAPHGFELAGICHLDLRTGREDVWDPGDRRAGEGFFVPAGRGEGEGYVLTYVWDRTTDRSSLAIFDAQAMAGGPVAEVQLPVRVPFGFHGLWVDEADL